MTSTGLLKVVMTLALGAGPVVASAQTEPYYDVNTIDSHRQGDFRPNQVIVKFKDSQKVRMRTTARGGVATSGVSAVDKVLAAHGVSAAEPLMPATGALPANAPRRLRAYNGRTIDLCDLSQLYCLRAADGTDVNTLVGELSALPEVEYAEPNYIVHACASAADYKADPLYSRQWGIPAIGLDRLWDVPALPGARRPVIAILDTGVDIAHPDLAANIWTNTAENSGAAGLDDDANGFTDDTHGWDFVNQSGNIDDFNGHGTHCAGIAAAAGGNGTGIAGANPDALIMPVTVMQSDGTGDVATIIKGIDYAAANGADVISMSFGGYSYSIAEEQALARAYSKAVLVAAAGNDGLCIYPHKCPITKEYGSPMFPAAFTFVLGVQANSPTGQAAFSNYDEDGPIYFNPQFFSEEQMYNYELSAPGTSIMSTYPGGRYKELNGTSMACPLVAGAVSRLISAKEYPTKELLFGDLIHTAGKNVDFMAAYNIKDSDRKPSVSLVSWRIDDEKDADGRFDAGETVNFYPTIRNEWGTAQNVRVWMEVGENEGKVVEFERTAADFSKPLSSYAKAESENPIRFKIADDVVDGRHIRLVVNAQCDGMDTPSSQEIVITAENGVEIGGMVREDMTLSPGVNYIVTNTLAIPKDVTLTIEPGTVIKFKDETGINCVGTVKCIGTPEKMITLTSTDNSAYNNVILGLTNLDYVIITNLSFTKAGNNLSGSNILIHDCIIDASLTPYAYKGTLKRSVITENKIPSSTWYNFHINTSQLDESNFIENNFLKKAVRISYNAQSDWFNGGLNILNNRTPDGIFALGINDTETYVKTIKSNAPCYFGSAIEKTARKGIWDIHKGWRFSEYDLSNMLLRPNPAAHGIVWKVVVDGYDTQDEFDLLPPLGVGRHKFEVYYSKVIDETETPTLAMGVRPPYTQTAIAADGSWRTETLPFSPLGNGRGQVDVINGNFDNDYTDWSGEGCIITSGSRSSNLTGFNGQYGYTHSHQSGVPNKMYQEVKGAQNGRYKLTISAHVDRLAENNNCQYVYLNDEKVYLDEKALNGAVYEVTADVRDNLIEVGICQTENIASQMNIDNVSLTLMEEYSNERMVPVSVYTAYLDITGKMAIDGLNRIYVDGGRDLEYFPIPREDMRFNVEVAAAGSMSTGFYGEAGLGKVMLTWEEQDENVDDILGYNLYRMADREETENVYDSELGQWIDKTVTVTDTVRINRRLLDETTFTDFDVVPGKTYSYYYKIMRTSMAENSPSRVVAVTPLTASKGDANGSMGVDIADVVTEVAYMLEQNPQPFIFEAADVNSDTEINILDVVGTLNIIMRPDDTAAMTDGLVRYRIDSDGVLYVESNIALAGLQFTIDGVTDSKQVTVLPALEGMEIAGGMTGESYMFMAYSMVGRTLAPGTHALLRINGGDVSFSGVTFSDKRGHNVAAEPMGSGTGAVETIEMTDGGSPWPNPFVDSVTIPYVMPFEGTHRVSLLIFDMNGRRIDTLTAGGVTAGRHEFSWTTGVQRGTYLATLYIDGKNSGITYRLIKK